MSTETIDTQDIAEMLGVTRAHATDVVVKQADFPAPVINRSRRIRRWAREAVQTWAAGGQSLDAMSAEVVR